MHSSQLLEGICTVCSAKQVVIKQFVQCIGKSLPIVRSTSVHGEHPWRGGVQRRAWCIPFSCLRRIVSHRRSCPSRYISTTLTLLPVKICLTFQTRKLVRICPKTGARRHWLVFGGFCPKTGARILFQRCLCGFEPNE